MRFSKLSGWDSKFGSPAIAGLALVIVLAACGGGGGGSTASAGAPSPTTPVAPAIGSSPLLGTTVPAQTASQVGSIASAIASAGASDTALAVPANTATGDSPVIATSQA